MDPFTIGALITSGGNLLSSLLSPRKSQFTADDLHQMLSSRARAGVAAIDQGVNDANQAAAMQAAQAGINTPNFLTRMIGLNTLGGGQQKMQLQGQLAGIEASGLQGIAETNLQAGQQYTGRIGETLGYISDPLAQMASLNYMVNDPRMLSLIRGEV